MHFNFYKSDVLQQYVPYKIGSMSEKRVVFKMENNFIRSDLAFKSLKIYHPKA